MADLSTTPDFTEGVCGDGAAILRDGVLMTISDVLATLNAQASEVVRLRRSMDAAIYADWLQSPDGKEFMRHG